MTSKTPAMLLQELSTKECGRGPTYQLIVQQQGTHENLFEYVVDVLGISASGRGRSKKEAKQETAKNALLELNDRFQMDCVPSNIAQSSQQMSPEADGELRKVVNYIGELDDICLRNKLSAPEYDLIYDSGPPHQKIFTYEGRFGSIVEKNTASTKKQARQNVAKQILDRLEGIELRPHCDIKISEFHLHLKMHMADLTLTFEDIKQFFEKPYTEEKLRLLAERLELELDIQDFTEEGSTEYIVSYGVNTVAPLCTMALASTLEEAKQRAMETLFERILNRAQ